MSWSRLVRNWLGMFVFFAFLGDYGFAGNFVVTIVSPVEGGAVPEEFIIVARIMDNGGYPFTEEGKQRWVEATLKNKGRQIIAQLPLRDHGQGTDKRRGDGEWSTPAILRLDEGQYRLIITVQRGDERYSHAAQFTVSYKAGRNEIFKGARSEADPKRLETRVEALTKSVRTLEGTAKGSWPVGLYIMAAVILGLAGIQIFLLSRHFWIQRSKGAQMEQVAEENKEDAALPSTGSEKWRPLFGGIETIQNAATMISRDLSSTFRANQQLKDQAMQVAEELIGLYRSVDVLNSPATQALKNHLGGVLKKAGVETWLPLVGEPAPEGCEQRPDPKSSAQYGVVSAVLQPGFRIYQGNETVVLVKPVVSVAMSTQEGAKL